MPTCSRIHCASVNAFCPISVWLTRGDSGLSELAVITMDTTIEKTLPPQIQAIPISALAKDIKLKPKESMWQFRVRLVATLLEHRVSLLMNDLDAIWIKDPLKNMIDRLPGSVSIAAARAQSPREFVLEWGAAVGNAFVYFKPTQYAVKFLEAVKKNWLPGSGVPDSLPPIPGDWINYALRRVNIGWPEELNKDRNHNPAQGRVVIGRSLAFGLDVALFDADEVSTNACRRVSGEREHFKHDVVVERCEMKNKTSSVKMLMSKVRNTWLLNHHWRQKNMSDLHFEAGYSTRQSAWKQILKKVVNSSILPLIPTKIIHVENPIFNKGTKRKKPKKKKYPHHVLDQMVIRAKQLDGPIILVMASYNYLVS